jgi:hypothetical protein
MTEFPRGLVHVENGPVSREKTGSEQFGGPHPVVNLVVPRMKFSFALSWSWRERGAGGPGWPSKYAVMAGDGRKPLMSTGLVPCLDPERNRHEQERRGASETPDHPSDAANKCAMSRSKEKMVAASKIKNGLQPARSARAPRLAPRLARCASR